MDGWRKADPPTIKKLLVEADVPEFLADIGRQAGATALQQAVGDLTLIAFYYLLRIGEYTGKPSRSETKQTEQFKLRDVTFFRRDKNGRLRQLPKNAPDHLIMSAESATLKLDNQKNGWKGGIPIDRIDTHSLRCGEANALALSGYSDRQIQKMGRWRSATFLEYIKESLFEFSAGMSSSMKRNFNFVNVEGGVFQDITVVTLNSAYKPN
eukprot:scaffold17176_cov147-Skeletonema_marinoi.AAC.1